MFNIGLKKGINKITRLGQPRFNRGQQDQMTTQVKKLLEQKEQGLILMVRN